MVEGEGGGLVRQFLTLNHQSSTINHRRTCRSEAVRGVKIVEPRERFAGREDRRGSRCDRDILLRIGCREVRVAAEIVVVEDVVVHRPAVVVAEPIAPVISIAPELTLPDDRFDLAGIGPDADVAAADVDLGLRVEG